MFIRPCYRKKDGKRHAYWALVESYRSVLGPRQRVVSYIGALEDDEIVECKPDKHVGALFVDDQNIKKRRVIEVDPDRVEVRRCRDFGGVWLGWELIRKLGLDIFAAQKMPAGEETVPWHLMSWVLVLSRMCDASSELYIAEHLYARSAMSDLLGIPEEKINDDRLYRALDELLPHKDDFEIYLKEKMGELFEIKYDLLLYDVTSTYFEGNVAGNTQAKRGYSRDHRPDCKQVCIGLVVSRCGMPLGYEVFDGNRHDSKTVREIVEKMESRYGKADRIWVMDRGMISEKNMSFLRESGRRYIIGTPRSQLKAFERELLSDDWQKIREGVEVKLCPSPDNADETFILCRSKDRRTKEKAMHDRFEQRIEAGLKKIEHSCQKRKNSASKVAQRVGSLMAKNTRSAKLFDIHITTGSDGVAQFKWSKKDAWREWAQLSEGCYLLRSNVADWTAEELWKAYIQLTDAETAFRIHKDDLSIRPIWHQKTERTQAHILVCFLSYVLWKALGQLCRKAGLGDEPRRIFDEIGNIRMVDVIMPTTDGREFLRRCITRPSDHQNILLQKLGLTLPKQLKTTKCSEDF